MANKIRICPVCKTWTSENQNTCEICGQDLILTKYTDLFFNKLSQEEQFEHVQEVIDGNRDGSNNQSIIVSPDINRTLTRAVFSFDLMHTERTSS